MAANSKRRPGNVAPCNSSRSWHLSRHVVFEPSDDFEALAEAVHEAWLKEAVRAGRYDHQHLKPYSALPDCVKEVNRATVRAVLDELCLSRVTKGGRS